MVGGLCPRRCRRRRLAACGSSTSPEPARGGTGPPTRAAAPAASSAHGGRDQDLGCQAAARCSPTRPGSCSTGSRSTPRRVELLRPCATDWPPLTGTRAWPRESAGRQARHDQAGQRPAPGDLRRPSAVPVQGRHQRRASGAAMASTPSGVPLVALTTSTVEQGMHQDTASVVERHAAAAARSGGAPAAAATATDAAPRAWRRLPYRATRRRHGGALRSRWNQTGRASAAGRARAAMR